MQATPHAFARRTLLRFDVAPLWRRQGWLRLSRRAMACQFEVVLPQDAVDDLAPAAEAFDEVGQIERRLSVFLERSEISAINRVAASDAVISSVEVFGLLDRCRELSAATGGAFDITTTPLSRCWGFLQHQGRVPDVSDIDAARQRVGMNRLLLDRATRGVRFTAPGMEVNLGAVGKGYALDRMAATLRRKGISTALLSAGASSLLAMGGSGNGWTIDVTSPRRDGRIARIQLRDGALGTSGAGEQFIVADGRRYGHVIDPRTGWPASGALSASVIADSAEMADALSTAFLVGGATLAHRYCTGHPNTLALITSEASPHRTFTIGHYRGAFVEN